MRGDLDRLRLAIWKVDNAAVRTMLQTAVNTAGADIDQVRRFIADWYDAGMDRVSGWYKRYTDAIVFIGGFALCAALNVNALLIGHALYQEPSLRASVVQAATQAINDEPAQPQPGMHGDPLGQINALGLPIGWDQHMRGVIASKLDIDSIGNFATPGKWVDPTFLVGLAALLR